MLGHDLDTGQPAGPVPCTPAVQGLLRTRRGERVLGSRYPPPFERKWGVLLFGDDKRAKMVHFAVKPSYQKKVVGPQGLRESRYIWYDYQVEIQHLPTYSWVGFMMIRTYFRKKIYLGGRFKEFSWCFPPLRLGEMFQIGLRTFFFQQWWFKNQL